VVGVVPVAARADDERSPYLFGPRPTGWGLAVGAYSGQVRGRGTLGRVRTRKDTHIASGARQPKDKIRNDEDDDQR
jgi:hypothetical protein